LTSPVLPDTDPPTMFELVVAAVLILLNGVFALSELAIVSARKARLGPMAERGLPGAAAAVRLSDNPGRFLSTVQIGITLFWRARSPAPRSAKG
jgi:putative hemolysin